MARKLERRLTPGPAQVLYKLAAHKVTSRPEASACPRRLFKIKIPGQRAKNEMRIHALHGGAQS